MKQTQLDIQVRYWNGNSVITEYLTSEFLGHAYASRICEVLQPTISEFGRRNLL